ncbi:FAD synthase [Candidatus Woesearchaeota archaeon]|nr:MAG: FAD synthase [Candidatus Woesearchaeota archaeon]
MKKVLAFGTFDILHRGHKHYLREAKKLGDYLVVVVARDKTVESVKHLIPIHTEEERLRRVANLVYVDEARLGNLEGDKLDIVKEINPDIIALGYDQTHFTENLEELGIKIVRISPFQPKVYKSTLLRKKLSGKK